MFCGARYGNWVVSKASNEHPPRPLMSEPLVFVAASSLPAVLFGFYLT